MKIAVAHVVAGDTLVLPNGREVTVDHVDSYPDDRWPDREPDGEIVIVSWWRVAEEGEPGAPRWHDDPAKAVAEHRDGRYLGQLKPLKPDETVEILPRDLKAIA